MATKLRQSLKSVLLAGAGISMLAPGAFAQTASLDEIVVTATKRAQTVQDVPLAISAISGENIEAYNVEDLNDLAQTIPNLNISDGITTQTITMRGLGTGPERTFEQAVGMFIDGQYMPRSRQYRSPFFDVERVEVVKGPQAVLFGLNSTAGAVSITSRKTMPGDEFSGTISGETELEFGGGKMSAAIGGSPSDNIGLRVAASYRDTDGYFENTTTGEDEGDTEQFLVRGTMTADVGSNSLITLKAEYADYKVQGNVGEIFGGSSPLLEPTDGVLDWRRSSELSLAPVAAQLGFFKNGAPGTEAKNLNLVASLETQFGSHDLLVMATHSEFEYDLTTDLDTWGTNGLDAAIDEDYNQQSIEARITSPDDDQFNYFIGAYYHKTDLSNEQPNIFGPAFFGPGTGFIQGTNFELDSDLFSVYGSGTYNFTEAARVIFGARYSNEKKNVLRPDDPCELLIFPNTVLTPPAGLAASQCTNPALIGFSDSRSSDNFMPEATLQFDASDDTMLYARIGKSAKAGGFSTSRVAAPEDLEYNDEKALGYEIGLKSKLFDGRAEFNATAFVNEFDDLQVNSFIVDSSSGTPIVTPNIQNAAKATSKGVEIDGRIALNEHFTLGGAFALLDAEYDSFEAGPCNNINNSPNALGFCDLSGEKLPFAADWSGNVYADFNYPLSDTLNGFAGASVSFSDEYRTDGTLTPVGLQDNWGRWSARIGVQYDDRWTLELIGNNLSNEAVNGSTQPFGSWNIGYLDPPRTVTLRVTANFGG